MAFFRKAVVTCAPRWPRKITLDGHQQTHWGLRRLRREDRRWKYVLVRNSQYLDNIVEQDHRAIKGRCRPMLGFKSYRTAAVTLAGIELAHRIRKRQFKFGPGRWICWSLKKQWIDPCVNSGDPQIRRTRQNPLTHQIRREAQCVE